MGYGAKDLNDRRDEALKIAIEHGFTEARQQGPVISDAELLAGLAFLQIHAHPAYHGALHMAEGACKQIRAEIQRGEVRMRAAEELEMSVRAALAIRQLGVKTVGDLEQLLDKIDLSSRDAKRAGFGKKCLKECREMLKNLGLEPRR